MLHDSAVLSLIMDSAWTRAPPIPAEMPCQACLNPPSSTSIGTPASAILSNSTCSVMWIIWHHICLLPYHSLDHIDPSPSPISHFMIGLMGLFTQFPFFAACLPPNYKHEEWAHWRSYSILIMLNFIHHILIHSHSTVRWWKCNSFVTCQAIDIKM